jgi:hypothetical protein
MNIRRRIFAALSITVLSAVVVTGAHATGTLIRWHKMGEAEGGTNNAPVSIAADSPVDGNDFQPLDLTAVNSPVYRTISGRPDGGGGIGIEFNSAASQYLTGEALNWPEDSPLSDVNSGLYDLQGIDDRGFQFWARPTSTAAQSLVMDTDRHGVRINSAGKFSMRFANVDYDSTIAAVANTWYHIELVRPAGIDSRSRLYINGVAAAVSAPVDYPSDHVTPMTVGASTAGNAEFFKGIIDDLRMYVYGTTTSDAQINYGTYNFATDNAFAASPITGLKGVPGDVNNSGSLTQADKDAFIAGWMQKNIVGGVQIGDLLSYSKGDLNLDGITNIQDLLLMQNALTGAGIATITAGELAGVPEPASAFLVILGLLSASTARRRRRATMTLP